jgi:YebC/PmpR family DNA-binding regulatory protein
MGRGPSIEGRKNASDAKRGAAFTKLARDIRIAARGGLPDPAHNAKLRAAVDKALVANMPKDSIERAIRRGAGLEGGAVEEIRYEGYGPGGVALLIDCLSDNPQRSVADVRHALSKHGGNLGTSGSVAFQFQRSGVVAIDSAGAAGIEEKVLEIALEAGADDVRNEAGQSIVLCAPEQFEALHKALQDAGLPIAHAGVEMLASNRVTVPAEALQPLRDLLDWLHDLDDVHEVFHNALLPDAQD